MWGWHGRCFLGANVPTWLLYPTQPVLSACIFQSKAPLPASGSPLGPPWGIVAIHHNGPYPSANGVQWVKPTAHHVCQPSQAERTHARFISRESLLVHRLGKLVVANGAKEAEVYVIALHYTGVVGHLIGEEEERDNDVVLI